MAHSKQALKRHRQSEKKRVVNKNARTRVRSVVKKLHAGTGDLADAMKKIDKAAKLGAIHKNAASRYKSRLAKALNKAKAKPAAK
jgi:small subunit ribosomal protein S20